MRTQVSSYEAALTGVARVTASPMDAAERYFMRSPVGGSSLGLSENVEDFEVMYVEHKNQSPRKD
jgi:hypothetical protein